jgi:hypothetical protein
MALNTRIIFNWHNYCHIFRERDNNPCSRPQLKQLPISIHGNIIEKKLAVSFYCYEQKLAVSIHDYSNEQQLAVSFYGYSEQQLAISIHGYNNRQVGC